MEYLHTNHMPHNVVRTSRKWEPRSHGHPVANDVRMGVSPEPFRSSGSFPAGFKYDDEPLAEFEPVVSTDRIFVVPNYLALLDS